MNEYPGAENPVKTQHDIDAQPSGTRILDDMSIRDFIDLLREQGMDSDAQFLSDMFEEMGGMDEQFSDMREKIQELQSEVEQLRGGTPLTDLFKTEFISRATQMRLQLEDLANRFLDAKNSLVATAKEGIRKFGEIGKSALHKACASMCNVGIKYFEGVMAGAHKGIEDNENILTRLDELKDSAKDTRQKRGNLVRAIFRLPDAKPSGARENALLHSIRGFAAHGVRFHGENLKISAEIIARIESVRDKQLAAVEKNPSFDNLLQNAKSRAEQLQNSMKDKFKSHDNSGPSR